MATVLLGIAGGALGGIFGPLGAIVGRAAGALIGSAIDQAIFAQPTKQEGPRLTSTDITTSTEGAPINRIYGRARTAGSLIWATRFEEVIVTEEVGGKGTSGKVETTNYVYYGNFAIGLCEGPIAGVGRIWADGKEIDLTLVEHRIYLGTADQGVDPLIEAKEGRAPAYRDTAYIVFERIDVTNWGNRLPQITAEVLRPVGDIEPAISGVALIPGNEHGLEPETHVYQVDGPTENRHTLVAATDLAASLDRLQMVCPNVRHVMLVVSWFGDDLRCGSCTVRPKIEAQKTTKPYQWSVAGLTRDTALLVSTVDGKPAFGGTPDDASVIRCLQALAARGLEVTYCPFIMMDIAAENTLPNPYSDNAADLGQPPYPWRGRVTCSPAAGFAGTVDKMATAAAQVSAFVGTADAGDFSAVAGAVHYTGPNEWSFRRFILHNAQLAAIGGVHSFLIGSEMVGLTQVRSSASAYPFVDELVAIAGEARSILGGGVKIGYGADWSEYHSHRLTDGSGDVFFNMDPLWSDANIDFVGIDNYLPLSDWRDGSAHLDFDPAGPTTIYDQSYLRSNVEGGEYYDWFYAGFAARQAQVRTPITDGAYGKPWVFRNKDIRGWWQAAHYDRPGGVESGAPTAWTPEGKPIRFTEFGCPAVDKGANQPNLFPDAKSSENGFPWFSSQARDDQMARSYLLATIGYWGTPGKNPVSAVYGGPMLDLSRSNVWTWDTRPWPSFPLGQDLWGDWPSFNTGHWISGRMGSAPALETIRTILDDAGFSLYAIEPIPGVGDGVTVGSLTSPRSLLESLQPVYQFDAVESDGVIKFQARQGRAPIATITADELVVGDNGQDGPRYRITRAQETELPDQLDIKYGDQARDDQPALASSFRLGGQSQRLVTYAPPVVMSDTRAREVAEQELQAAVVGRERYDFTLPPSRLALDPGDVVAFAPSGHLIKLGSIGEAEARKAEAFEVDPLAGGTVKSTSTGGPRAPRVNILPPQAIVADMAMLRDADVEHAPYVAGLISPFRRGLGLWRSPSTSGYQLDTLIGLPGSIGETTADLRSGPVARWDRVNAVHLDLMRGSLSSATELEVLNGKNVILVENQDGEWEVIQFATATPAGGRSWALTNLLRGQRGTEHAMRDPVPAGARLLVVDAAVRQSSLPAELVGVALNWRAGAIDRGAGAPDTEQLALTPRRKGRRPLSVAHLRGRRDPATGDWIIFWIRRTRIGGDGWDQVEVPLAEASEAYRLEILSGGGAVLRTLEPSVPIQLYTAAQQTADFGAPQLSFTARVAQLSQSYGAGIATTAVI